MSALDIIEKRKYWILAFLILTFSVYQFNIVKDFKQPPACLYGCDHYNHLGKVYHLYEGGSFFADATNADVAPWVPNLYHAMITLYGKTFGLDPTKAFNTFTLITGVLCIVIVFFLFRALFQHALYGFLAAVLYLRFFPVVKYTPFTTIVMFPLFFLVFFRFYKERNYLNAALCGVVFGLIALTSSNGFIAVTLFTGIGFFYLGWNQIKTIFYDKENLKTFWKTHVLPFVVLVSIGVGISMIYWYQPIFINQMHMQNLQSQYDVPDMGMPSIFLREVYRSVRDIFFAWGSLYYMVLTGLYLLGLFFLVSVKAKGESSILKDFLLFCFVVGAVSALSFIVIYPVTGINLMTGWTIGFVFTTLRVMIAFFAVSTLVKILQNKSAPRANMFLAGASLVLLIIAVTGSIETAQFNKQDRFFQNAYNDIDPAQKKVQEWVLENTQVNDVFLTTNEIGFALNGLTGRKMMTFRRSHASQFLNFNEIMADAAIILYGNNTEKTAELLRKHNVKYFYWDAFWMQSEFQFDQEGKLAGFFDPLVIMDTPENRAYLSQYNVTFIPKHWFIDPGVQGDDIRQFDLLFIMPNRFDAQTPWSETFSKFITLKSEVTSAGQPYARIYSIQKG